MGSHRKCRRKSAGIPCVQGEQERNTALLDQTAERGSQPLLFPKEEQEGSGKGAWNQQPGGICHTFAGSPEAAEEISVRGSGRKGGGGFMRGKKPKEREKYIIRMGDGTLVEVNREIYLEWYRSERRERYQRERDRKYGVCSLERLEENGRLDEINEYMGNVTQEAAMRNIWRDKLQNALIRISTQDAQLIWLLYFEEITLKEVAKIFGCSRKSVRNNLARILRELNCILRMYDK